MKEEIKGSLMKKKFADIEKNPKASFHTRRLEVFELMEQGYTSNSIISMITETHGISDKTVWADIAYNRGKIVAYYDKQREYIISDHLSKYDRIIEDSERFGDTRGKILALQAKEKLLKLHAPEVAVQVNNNAVTIDLKDYSIDDLKKLLNN